MCAHTNESSIPPLADVLVRPGIFEPGNKTNCAIPRMHINIDLANSPQYLATEPQPSDGIQMDTPTAALPDVSCASGPPPTVAYRAQDLTSFSAVSRVSSFNQPAAVDSTLLTPVSSASSPPIQQRPPKVQPYQQDQSSSSQQPTPPHTSTMYYPYNISSNHSSSPMTVPPQVTEAPPQDLLSGYHLNNSPPESPLPPPQDQPYFGHYTASAPAALPPGSEGGHGLPPYQTVYPSMSMESSPYMLRTALPDVGVDASGAYPHRPLASLAQPPIMAAAAAPILQRPHPSHLRERSVLLPRAMPGDWRGASPISKRQPQRKRAAARPPRGAAAKRERSSYGSSSQPRGQQQQSAAAALGPQGQQQQQPVVRADDGGGEEEEVVTLRESAPEPIKKLFALRQKYRGDKGRGMWEEIMKELEQDPEWKQSREGRDITKENLQMKIHRKAMKYVIWPEKESQALIQIWIEDQQDRYNRYVRELKRRGFCKAWEWKAPHVEAQLVALGLEEKGLDPERKARKRKWVAPLHPRVGTARGRQSQQAQAQAASVAAATVYDAAAAHYHQQQQQQYGPTMPAGAGGRRPPSYGDVLGGPPPPPLTEEESEELARSIWDNRAMELTPEPGDPMALAYPEDPLEPRHPGASLLPDINVQRSEAVARQACGELMKSQFAMS